MNIQRPFLVEFMKYRVLNKNREFTRLYARGKSYVHPHLVLYVAKNRLGVTRVGLTATKKVGGAVQRNRARRDAPYCLARRASAAPAGIAEAVFHIVSVVCVRRPP